ncbi:uncharacterized protein LOC126353748 [Schistocerca gregaria]|uniref:uncharacterized protein LOC126353748 n=1 Tax=Schistocerca gregaria TaxID=7010 RepID=UPI00211F34A7|nr:uncharacterized protein LOC126353748 [Schistocerca gregaria]XP_049858751.1 uncharacterized protein LOC126353748 [Schistocerca gregaria]XP_049858752.1 uncharacterized protein LOC126353748 [Schistocerca gregaria]XP_049858753.1 uncharacterized protein LOC126353748 [Schistocerca gregaria]XP_049858754.1 uncharacterized protein LOC126353748 [Schistocerca gregaria]
MMLRNKKVLANISGVAVKRKMARNRSALKQSQSEGRLEAKSTRKHDSVLHHCTDLCKSLSSCDYISGAEQSSSIAEHSSMSLTKNTPSAEVGKCSSALVGSNTSSSQVLPKSNKTADLKASTVSEDSVRSLDMEDSIVEVIPIEISDVSILETKSHKPSSSGNKPIDADTSDVIIIPDSPGQGTAGNKASKTTSNEVSHVQRGRKRKNSDDSGIEILCDISGSRPKKQQKINIASKGSSGDGDDIIFISAEDDEVSVIKTKEEHKTPQEDVIILDSPPAQTPVQNSDKSPKKMVSASTSVTGLIPHYTQHLIDYISLDGRPPVNISDSSIGTPVLPFSLRDAFRDEEEMVQRRIPVLRRAQGTRASIRRQRERAAFHNRLVHARSQAGRSNCIPVSTCAYFPPRPSNALIGNQTSTIRNAAENSTAQNSTNQNVASENSVQQNSTTQNVAPENSVQQNSTTQNVAPENSVQSAPEVSQSPACVYGTNIYNPNASDKEKDGLRPVIIDGNNIAMGHGKGKCFSWRGLHICIKYFLKRGHKVTAFVPTFRRGACPPDLRSELEEYERSGQVVFTPSRRIEGRLIVPYDDRFIVQCAAELGGVIVSTDNFRDLLSENTTWKETIEKRLLMFTWVGDLLMFPHDPLGRNGPKFEEFLRFPKKL